MFIICTVQFVWIKPKIQPILFYIPFIREISCLSFKNWKGWGVGGGGGAGLNDILRQSFAFAFGRGGVYCLDLAPCRQYMEKIRNSLNKKKKKIYITDTPFEHYYFGCIKKTHIAGQNDVRFISNHNELHTWRFNTWRQMFNRRKIELSVVVV